MPYAGLYGRQRSYINQTLRFEFIINYRWAAYMDGMRKDFRPKSVSRQIVVIIAMSPTLVFA